MDYPDFNKKRYLNRAEVNTKLDEIRRNLTAKGWFSENKEPRKITLSPETEFSDNEEVKADFKPVISQ